MRFWGNSAGDRCVCDGKSVGMKKIADLMPESGLEKAIGLLVNASSVFLA